ncbi:MAG: MFS transporter [Acidimicrobiales bacterium]|nr:MFS transporter [Acidimicrobiales bacterium]
MSLRTAARRTFASLEHRNFRLFFVGQGISQVGNWMTLVAQTLLVLKLTDSGVALGLLAAAQFGPVLLLGPWAGLVADRSDKRKLLVTVQVAAMMQSFVLAALAFTGDPPVGALYAVAVVGGLCMAFDNPARRSFVVEMVPALQINNAVSLNSALMTSSRVIGPALAGALVSTVGYGWAFTVDALSYIAVLAGLLMMRTSELHPSPVATRAKGQIRAGLRYVRSVPELFVPLVMMAVIGTLSYNFQTVFPLFVTRDLQGSEATFTVLFSVVSVGSLAGALVTANRGDIGVRQVSLAAVAYGVALALMALAPTVAVAVVLGVVVGVASITFLVSSTAIVQIKAAADMRGRVLALQAMLFLGSTPVGGPVVGWIADQFGARYSVALGAIAAFGAGLWGLAVLRRASEEPAPAAGGDETDAAVVDGRPEARVA